MQNAPIYSRNTTNDTSTYVFDANNLRYLDLVYNTDHDSYICSNGTGDQCTDSYDRQTTIYRENDHGERILPVAVESAYNLPTVSVQHDQITQDAHSGYTTNNLNW